MTDEKKPFWRPSVIVAILLSWLGLAGLSDAIVEWKNWFEIGVMTHWRDVKNWLLQWVPFDIPSWVIDYTLLGLVYLRSVLVLDHVWANDEVEHDSDMEGVSTESKRERLRRWLDAFIIVFLALISWPLLLLSSVIQGTKFNETDNEVRDSRRVLLVFLATLVCFIPILFVLTNEILPLTG